VSPCVPDGYRREFEAMINHYKRHNYSSFFIEKYANMRTYHCINKLHILLRLLKFKKVSSDDKFDDLYAIARDIYNIDRSSHG
jgi:hypothetical protein